MRFLVLLGSMSLTACTVCASVGVDPDTGAGDTGASDTGSGAGWGHVAFDGLCSDGWRLRQVPTAAPLGAWVVDGWVASDDPMNHDHARLGPWVTLATDQPPASETGWTHIQVDCGVTASPVPWHVDVWFPEG